jgi:hypothetical protein
MKGLARRDLLRGAPLAAAAQTTAPAKAADWSRVRQDFPWLKNRLWLTAADYHPL